MPHKIRLTAFGLVVVLGSAWGAAEAGLGLALNACAKSASGSIMTGLAVFFLVAARLKTGSARGPLLAAVLAAGFKLFDAALLGLPVRDGAVANPVFALALETAAVVLIFGAFARAESQGRKGQALIGVGAAGLSALAFPLVNLATGVPACLRPGSSLPLSVAFAPLALAAGALAAPLAFAFSTRAAAGTGEIHPALRWAAPAAAAFLGLVAVALLRAA